MDRFDEELKVARILARTAKTEACKCLITHVHAHASQLNCEASFCLSMHHTYLYNGNTCTIIF